MSQQMKTANENAPRGAISIKNVSKIYDPDGARVLAVDNCSMEVEAGEFCVVVGPSGCGKTTLLNAIAGFHGISEGEIRLDGELLCAGNQQATPGSDRCGVSERCAVSLVYGS